MVPIIETERLRLREARSSDLDPLASALAAPEIVLAMRGAPPSREEAWRKLLAASGLWMLLGYGYWALERKADGAFIGQAGFADFNRQLEPSIDGIPEIGWLIVPSAQGQGFAGEAAAAAVQWADRALRGQALAAIINHDNHRSIRVAEKIGFIRREEARYKDEPILLFRRPPRLPAGSAATTATAA